MPQWSAFVSALADADDAAEQTAVEPTNEAAESPGKILLPLSL